MLADMYFIISSPVALVCISRNTVVIASRVQTPDIYVEIMIVTFAYENNILELVALVSGSNKRRETSEA